MQREREREKERCIYLGKRALFCGVSEGKKMESRKRNRTYSLRHRLDILANNWKKENAGFHSSFSISFFLYFFFKNMLEK